MKKDKERNISQTRKAIYAGIIASLITTAIIFIGRNLYKEIILSRNDKKIVLNLFQAGDYSSTIKKIDAFRNQYRFSNKINKLRLSIIKSNSLIHLSGKKESYKNEYLLKSALNELLVQLNSTFSYPFLKQIVGYFEKSQYDLKKHGKNFKNESLTELETHIKNKINSDELFKKNTSLFIPIGASKALIGRLYLELAYFKDSKRNLEQALVYLQQAEHYFQLKEFDSLIIDVLTDMGTIYFLLYDFNEEVEHAIKSKEYFSKALEKCSPKSNLEEELYIKTMTELMQIRTSDNNSFMQCEQITNSMTSLKEIEKSIDIEIQPYLYALVHHSIGLGNSELYKILIENENWKKALIEYFKQKGKIVSLSEIENDPFINMSIPFTKESKKDLLSQSIDSFEKALQIYTLENAPLLYSGTIENLGISYMYLHKETNDEKYLHKAKNYFEAAQKIVNFCDFPINGAKNHFNQGLMYKYFSKIRNKDENIKRSIYHLEIALGIFKKKNYPKIHEKIEQTLQRTKKEL